MRRHSGATDLRDVVVDHAQQLLRMHLQRFHAVEEPPRLRAAQNIGLDGGDARQYRPGAGLTVPLHPVLRGQKQNIHEANERDADTSRAAKRSRTLMAADNIRWQPLIEESYVFL